MTQIGLKKSGGFVARAPILKTPRLARSKSARTATSRAARAQFVQNVQGYGGFWFWHGIGDSIHRSTRRTNLKSALATRLFERLQSRQANVGVVGLGYVGLPLAVEFAHGGLTAVGIDLDARKVAAVGRGESYIPDVPSSDVAPLVAAGRLRATT